MSSKPNSTVFKNSCDKYRTNLSSVSDKRVKIKLPKKVVISKKWHQNCSHDAKSKSAGFIDSKQIVKPKKTTKSESTVPRNATRLDFCKKCGDTDDDVATAVSEYTGTINNISNKSLNKHALGNDRLEIGFKIIEKQKRMVQHYKNENNDDVTEITNLTSRTSKMDIRDEDEQSKSSNNKEHEKKTIQEYYKNERFETLYDSMHDIDDGLRNVATLETITEVNERQTQSQKASATESKVFIIETSDDETNIKQLKEFRDKNYFECHSARSRVDNRGSVTSLKDHKCSYRFYLNNRLFPEAINKDYNDNVRCVDCHLPLELSRKDFIANGTIQAKVKLGSETQDMMLLLPVKEPLIVQQKKKEKNNTEVVYFGVIKLDQNGNSVFKRSLPYDSLALKYQKGYREFKNSESYKYDKVDEGDVIVI